MNALRKVRGKPMTARTTCLLLLFVLLVPACACAQSGDLQVTCEPRVRIFIDGAFRGVTNEGDSGLFVEGLAPGEHTLKAVRTGSSPVIRKVTIFSNAAIEVKVSFAEEGEQTESPVTLAPEPRGDIGTFVLSSEPRGARIYIDDAFRGDADLIVQNLPAGSHRIEFRLGKRKLSGTYTLRAKETLKLTASFQKNRIINISEMQKGRRKKVVLE